MSDPYKVTIGFGDRRGLTSLVIVQQSKRKIEKNLSKKGWGENPRLKLKELPEVELGGLNNLLRNRRNKNLLTELIKLDALDLHEINSNNERLMKNIDDEEAMLGVFKQENEAQQKEKKQNERFVRETKASAEVARNYCRKYKNVDNAIQVYKEHQVKIEKFMKNNNCNRENAISFLENNNYEIFQ